MARNQTVIGLDIGRYAAKAVWVERRGGKPVVTRAEMVRLPLERAMASNILAPWIQKHGIARHPCVLGIPGSQCLFHPFMLVPGDPRTIEQAAAMEVVRFNEMAQDVMHFGMTPFSLSPDERRVMLAMTRPSVLDEAFAATRGFGINVIDAGPTPIALFNLLESQAPEHPVPCVYVNIGQTGTEIVIGMKSGPVFARSFACGGQMFTDGVAAAAKLPPSQAENLKITEASLARTDNLTPSLIRTVDTWVSEYSACMSMFQSLYPGRNVTPTQMILAGGGAELNGLADHLTSRLKLHVTSVNTLPGLSTVEHPAQFAPAAGLALSGLDLAISNVSLLPHDVRDELTFRRQKPYWIAAGIAAALILAVSLAGGYMDFQRREKVLRRQQASLSKRQTVRDNIENTKAVSAQVHAMATPLRELMGTAPLMSKFMEYLVSSLARGDWLQLVCDSDSYFSREDLPKPKAQKLTREAASNPLSKAGAIKPQTRLQCVVVEGYTRTSNFSTVKALIAKLKQADFVAGADLLSDDKLLDLPRSEEIPGARRFVIEVRLK